jgi:WD40 repeat protein
MPYTSPFGNIISFIVAIFDNVPYLLTAGAEGIIRFWQFDAAENKFKTLNVLEGHLRAVTCMALNGSHLWSGSLDSTIRVWDMSNGTCVGVLSSSNNGVGHSEAVSALCVVPPHPSSQETYIASGGADKELKYWKSNGEFAHSMSHPDVITALAVLNDEDIGVQTLVVGLANGTIFLRACTNLALICVVDSSICRTSTVWGIQSLGKVSE